jgi:hypothetical protein
MTPLLLYEISLKLRAKKDEFTTETWLVWLATRIDLFDRPDAFNYQLYGPLGKDNVKSSAGLIRKAFVLFGMDTSILEGL